MDIATLDVVPRQEFVREFSHNYSQGSHVTMLGPTQRGKTTLCFELLGQVITPDHKCVILSGKPPSRDDVMEGAAKQLNLRVIDEWPPTYSIRDRKRNGYVLRPHQTMKDLEADEVNIRKQFKAAMMANYASKKPVITVCDEAFQVQNNLKLRDEYEAPLMRGAPINAQWSLLQRGRFSSYLAYDAPDHIFIAMDPDVSNQKRYSEIGGVDPKLVATIVSELRTKTVKTKKGGRTISEFLYINRSGPEMCIVSMD